MCCVHLHDIAAHRQWPKAKISLFVFAGLNVLDVILTAKRGINRKGSVSLGHKKETSIVYGLQGKHYGQVVLRVVRACYGQRVRFVEAGRKRWNYR